MLTSLILFAEEEVKKDQTPPWMNPIMLVPIIFGLFYFLVLRPQQRKQRQEQEDLMTNLKKNDKVLTTSGIIGIVWQIKDAKEGALPEVVLKIDDNARITVLRTSISQIIKKDEATPAVVTTPASTDIKPTA